MTTSSTARAARRQVKKQSQATIPALPPDQDAIAQQIGARLPALFLADVVVALLPNGDQLLIKGRRFLDEIADNSRPAQAALEMVPLPELEAAAALEQLLGNDGNLTPRTFGGTVYGGQVGHA